MGEEEKKPEEKKVEMPKKDEEKKKPAEEPKKDEEKKKPPEDEKKPPEEASKEEKKDEEAAPPPPPPEEIIMRIYMHCEGCAKKVQRSLKGFEGVESVTTDCRTHKVVVKGKVAAADPLKVVDRVQKKTGRKVELLTPIPPKPEKKEEEKKEEEKPKPEEKKEEPQVVTVVLKVHMHCEACSLEIKKRILKMKGVHSVDPDLKGSQVTVKGVMEPQKLVEYVYKRTGKHAVIVKRDPPEKKAEEGEGEKAKGEQGEVKKEGGEEKEKKEGGEEKKEGGEGKGEKNGEEKKEGEEKEKKEEKMAEEAAAKVVELKRNELYYYYPRLNVEYAYTYPPQIFSDENPNACSVM